MAVNTVLAKMAVKIAADTAEFKGALAKTQGELKGFQTNLTKIAGGIGIAFGVREVAAFAFEVSQLAGEAEGVRAAFNKLPGSIGLMLDLKEATKGTVSELDLMKRTTQAANFGISLQSLPKLLEFASVRAQQTGQSVDYLVDSIVTGIGRKSPLILDNLGISAVALREKMNGVSIAAADIGDVADAVGAIAAESLQTMGEYSENAQTKVQRLSASWTNFKVAIGEAANGTGILGTALDALGGSLDVASSKNLSFFEKLTGLLGGGFSFAQARIDDYTREIQKANEEQAKQEQIIREVDHAFKEFGGNIDAYAKVITQHIYQTELLAEFQKRLVTQEKERHKTLEDLKAQLDELNGVFNQTDVNDQKKLANIGREIVAVQAQIDKLEALRKKMKEVNEQPLKTKFAQDQLSNAQQGLETPFTDFSQPDPVENPFSNMAEVPDITPQMDAYVEQINRGRDAWKNSSETLMILGEINDAEFEKQKNAALEYGNAIGDALGDAISGQQSAADALKKISASIIQTFLKQALAGIIASATKSGGPPPVVLGLAAAGVAAISAMFSKLGASGGGGGSGRSMASSASRATQRQTGSLSDKGYEINLSVIEQRIEGEDLVYIIGRTEQKNQRRRG